MSAAGGSLSEESRTAAIGRAYDAAATDYDRQLRSARWLRRVLWLHFDRIFRPGQRLLDVGCGTGLDTLRLASRGLHVTAIDASAGMIDRLRSKARAAALESRVTVCTGDVVEVLRTLDGPFDGLISSFAALNTVDLASFVPEAARLLAPGAPFVAQLLAPGHRAPLRTRLWHLVPLPHPAEAHEERIDIHGHGLAHRLATRDGLAARFFDASFLARPRSWLEPVMAVASVGRFYVLDLERRPPPGNRDAEAMPT